jgi:hypothetical protein
MSRSARLCPEVGLHAPPKRCGAGAEHAPAREGFDGMLRKCLCDGKALVLEGLHCHTVRVGVNKWHLHRR